MVMVYQKSKGTVCRFWIVQINTNVACFVGMGDDKHLLVNLDNYFDSAQENNFEALWLRHVNRGNR